MSSSPSAAPTAFNASTTFGVAVTSSDPSQPAVFPSSGGVGATDSEMTTAALVASVNPRQALSAVNGPAADPDLEPTSGNPDEPRPGLSNKTKFGIVLVAILAAAILAGGLVHGLYKDIRNWV